MEIVEIGNTKIAYLDSGEGYPVVLVHGFSSNAKTNWLNTNWINDLNKAGYRVIALDNRGHGASTKYYDENEYSLQAMAGDVAGLIDELGLQKPHLMGYSMGARIVTTLAAELGDRIGKLVIAGNGYNMIEGGFDTEEVRQALLANSIDDVPAGRGADFRKFAEGTGNDLKALAACIKGRPISIETFQSLVNETLVIFGDQDDIATHGDKLAAIIPNARYEIIPKRNHMNAVGDPIYKEKVLKFLAE